MSIQGNVNQIIGLTGAALALGKKAIGTKKPPHLPHLPRPPKQSNRRQKIGSGLSTKPRAVYTRVSATRLKTTFSASWGRANAERSRKCTGKIRYSEQESPARRLYAVYARCRGQGGVNGYYGYEDGGSEQRPLRQPGRY